MLIGIDASRAAKKEKTGVEWYAYHVLNAMRGIPSAHRFRLYASETALPFELQKNWEHRNVQWPFPFLWTQGGLSLEMLAHPPDTLFVPSSALPVVLPKKCVATMHDVGFLFWRSYRSKNELRYLDWSTRFAVRRATRIIAVSEFTKQELIRHYDAPAKKIIVTHLAYEPVKLLSEDETKSVLSRFHIHKPYILFVSRIDSRKNISALVNAFRRVRDEKLFDGDLVMAGPAGFDGEKIMADIQSGPHAESIHILGWISEQEKHALFARAEIFVFPSLYEGFGMAVLEAQSAGVPVICSETTSLPEVAGDGALFIDPLSVDSIVDAIQTICSDATTRKELVIRGTRNVCRFSWERTAQETLAVFDSLIESK